MDGARATLERVEASVGRDPVQPGPKRRTALEARALQPRPHECLLNEVLGILVRAEHPVAVDLQLTAVALDERGEGGLVTRPRGRDDRSGFRRALLDLDRAHKAFPSLSS